ncbi:MAG TPA: cation-transporting P-type ATPase, partial [Myxococcota bacterium]|nr:cation-transporting P-type ATPase [Myxococcota bacterium]
MSATQLAPLLERLGTSDAGLSSAEAAAELARSGPNDFVAKSWLASALELLRSAANPLVLILLVAAGAAA